MHVLRNFTKFEKKNLFDRQLEWGSELCFLGRLHSPGFNIIIIMLFDWVGVCTYVYVIKYEKKTF